MSSTQRAAFVEGFEALESEVCDVSLEIHGDIPPWVSGVLLRNGPAHYGSGSKTVNHWFDGQAMIHRFAIADHEIRYSNRFLDTPAKRAVIDRGTIEYPEFATDPCQSLFAKVFTSFAGKPPNYNAAVNIVPMGGVLTAVTETPLPIQFDDRTLETVGVVKYQDPLKGDVTTAHPQKRPGTDTIVNYLLKFSRKSSYLIYTQDADGFTRNEVARLRVEKPSYMHSFGITGEHAILVEFPYVVDPLSFVFRRRPFIQNYRWRPDRGTRISLVDLDSGAVSTYRFDGPLFAFHHVNSFTENDCVHIDLVAYENAEVVDAFYLEQLRNGALVPAPKLVRLTVDTATGRVTRRTLSDHASELPRIDTARAGLPYRYVYGNGVREEGDFLDELVKIDVHTGEATRWGEVGNYPGEPVFIPRPGRKAGPDGEDDGVLLTVVLDTALSSSYLSVLDARTLVERARAYAPHTIPLGFHGGFIPRHPQSPSDSTSKGTP